MLYQEQLRSLTSELSLAEESESRRIATQIHDHIGQTLAITKIKLGALKDACDSGHAGTIDEIRSLIEKTIKYTKSLTFELSPPILYELGLRRQSNGSPNRCRNSTTSSFRSKPTQRPNPSPGR